MDADGKRRQKEFMIFDFRFTIESRMTRSVLDCAGPLAFLDRANYVVFSTKSIFAFAARHGAASARRRPAANF
jgi:hypothetical protein